MNSGGRNGGNVLKNTIHNFFDSSELEQICNEFKNKPQWQYQQMSGGQWWWCYMLFDNNKRFTANNNQQWETASPVWRHVYDKICNLAGDNFVTWRFIINGQTIGQNGHPHSDFSKEVNNRTTYLVYSNQEWDKSWGGETIFYNNNGVEHREFPEPGKLLEYNGSIVHEGTPPVLPNLLRVTLSMQGEY